MPFPFPYRGQQSPDFWDTILKTYIDGTIGEADDAVLDQVAADVDDTGSSIGAALSATYAPVAEPVGAAAQTSANTAQTTANAAVGLAFVMGA